ncbi:MAG: hypothetical protein IMY71_11035 [Bacteroidetes bacterium]|nr:hypothetical protein [Bacteroidota bacterium]
MNKVIKDFHRGTTVGFSVKIYVNGDNPNISGDEVIFVMKKNKKDTDANASIKKNADVSASGAGGLALFLLTTEDTNVAPRKKYYYDVQWISTTYGEKIVGDDIVFVKERVSDV